MNSDSLKMVSRLGEGHMPGSFFLSEPQLKTTVDSAWSRVKEGFRNLPVRRTRSSNTKVTTEFLKIKIGIQMCCIEILRNM